MIANFLKYLEFEKRSSLHTIHAYEEDLDQFNAFLKLTFEITAFDEVKHVHLRNWVIELVDQGLSPATVNRKIACLKSFFKFLKGREFIDHNPSARLKPLKAEKRLPAFVKENDLTYLIDHVQVDPEDFKGQRDRLIMDLLYGTGIRLSELIGLKTADFDPYQKTIKVLGKRNKERVIPVPDSVVNTINSYIQKKALPSDHLLVTDSGKQLYPMFVYRTVKKYLSLVSTVAKKSPHVLRHTFATHLLDKGADLNAVKDLLGHTSLAATQVYTHNSLEKLKSAFDQAHPKA